MWEECLRQEEQGGRRSENEFAYSIGCIFIFPE